MKIKRIVFLVSIILLLVILSLGILNYMIKQDYMLPKSNKIIVI